MKMISSTSTTSTSGVMLMLACILPGSPSRMLYLPRLVDDLTHHDVFHFEQAVHKLIRSTIHFDMETFEFPREVVEGDNGRNSDEDTQRCRNQGFSNTARDRGHTTG